MSRKLTETKVQTGDSLWSIAKHVLGDGRCWHEIYRLNVDAILVAQVQRKSLLRGPQWIYPETILRIPKVCAALAQSSSKEEK